MDKDVVRFDGQWDLLLAILGADTGASIGLVTFVLVFLAAIHFSKKRRFRVEEALLTDYHLNRTALIINDDNPIIDMPSRKIKTGMFKNLILSKIDTNLAIFTWLVPFTNYSSWSADQQEVQVRVFSFASSKGNKFPLFNLQPEGFYGKFKTSIKYELHTDFSKSFYLTPLGGGENAKKVKELFDDPSIHEYLFSNMTAVFSKHINIESNGKRIFYYWDTHDMVVERFPEIIRELKTLHDKYFDT